jgi:hypothetical protein
VSASHLLVIDVESSQGVLATWVQLGVVLGMDPEESTKQTGCVVALVQNLNINRFYRSATPRLKDIRHKQEAFEVVPQTGAICCKMPESWK